MEDDPKSVAWIRQQFDAEQRIFEADGAPGFASSEFAPAPPDTASHLS
ncbi:hypothetical protein [Ralstonia solanacearum]|nr:hypothetical protein [Ralstonia solanacearum]